MDNVFSPPGSDLNAPPIRRHESTVSDGIIDAMSSTRPWVMFFSILGFLAAALTMCLGGFVSLTGIIGSAGAATESGLAGTLGAGGMLLGGVLYFLIGLVYIIPSRYLWRFASEIEDLKINPSPETLEKALVQQKSFWKFLGIMTLGMFVIYFLIFIVMIVGGLAALSAGA